MLKIIYEDHDLLAVNKPAGSLVHKSYYARDCKDCLLQEIEEAYGHQKIYPVHRLDRGTSGLLLFAKSSQVAAKLSQQFRDQTVEKLYLTIVRGYFPSGTQTVDYSLAAVDKPAPTRKLEALTELLCLARRELTDRPPGLRTSRYSLLLAKPRSGRQHQIRRHLLHLHHPIIGDTRYGKGDQNRFFRQHFGIHRLLLHSYALAFTHPTNASRRELYVEPDKFFGSFFALHQETLTPASLGFQDLQ